MTIKKIFILSVLIVFSICTIAFAKREHLMGKEWLKLSEQRKLYFIFSCREEYEEKGVIFNHSAYDYILLMDEKIKKKQELKTRSMDDVFYETVYENEPQARPRIPSSSKPDSK